MKGFLFSVMIISGLYACRKERTCECKNSITKYEAGTVEATRSQAKKRCSNLSSGDTQCYLKK